VIEAHAVDERSGLGQAEDARAWIARLRAWRHGAHFDEAEAERGKPVDAGAFLVEPRREPDRIAERDAHDGARQIRHMRREKACKAGAASGAEHTQREVVGVFRIHAKETGAY